MELASWPDRRMNLQSPSIGGCDGLFFGHGSPSFRQNGRLAMVSAWDRPSTGSPFRLGDPNAEMLYLSVGRALTKWELLEGQIVDLYAAIIGANDPSYYKYAPAIRAFGSITSPATRADLIQAAAESYFYYLGFKAGIDLEKLEAMQFEAVEKELREILKMYRGWMARRNDVAHGCVRANQSDTDQTTYLLFPSEGAERKWCIILGEPDYAYEAKHIDDFGVAFDKLSETVDTLVDRLQALEAA